MGLNDEIGNPFLGGVWQFNVARSGCGEYGTGARNNLHTWFRSEHRRSRTVILDRSFQCVFSSVSLSTCSLLNEDR